MNDAINSPNHYAKGLQELIEKGIPEAIRPLIENFPGEMKAGLEKAQVVGEKAVRVAEKTVRNHPFVTVLAITAAVGLVWSLFAGKSPNSKSDYAY